MKYVHIKMRMCTITWLLSLFNASTALFADQSLPISLNLFLSNKPIVQVLAQSFTIWIILKSPFSKLFYIFKRLQSVNLAFFTFQRNANWGALPLPCTYNTWLTIWIRCYWNAELKGCGMFHFILYLNCGMWRCNLWARWH